MFASKHIVTTQFYSKSLICQSVPVKLLPNIRFLDILICPYISIVVIISVTAQSVQYPRMQTWRRWESDYESYRDAYYRASMESNLYTMQKLAEEAALVDLKGELTNLENQQAAIIRAISENLQEESALKDINNQIKSKKEEIAAQESKVAATDQRLSEIQNTLSGINKSLAWDAKDKNGNDIYFTPEELQILKKYIIEDSVQDSSFVAATTATYSNKDSSTSLHDIQLRVKDSRIDSVDDNGNPTGSITGGTLDVGSLSAEIIRATVSFRSDKSFVFTASLSKGTIGEAEFDSGNLTVIGNYKTKSESASALSFKVYDGTLYFTKNTTAYEQHMVEWELYEYGKQVLEKKSSPAYEFSIDSGNFLAAEDFVSFKNELELGKRVYLKLGDAEVLKPYVVAVRINYEDASDFSLDFSSTYSTFNRQFSLATLLEQSVSLGKTLNAKSGVYEQFVSSGANGAVKNFMDSALDIAKNMVLSTGQQAIEFGDAGIRVRKWKTDDSGNQTTAYEPEEIWIVDNMIAFTDDNWNTAKMAIGKIFDSNLKNPDGTKGGTIYGIAAPYLVGTILAGRNLFIDTENGCFRVDESGVTLDSLNMNIVDSGGGGLTFDASKGLKHTVKDGGKTYEAGFSASNSNGENYGLYFKVDGDKKLYFDVDKPELVVDGDIWARDIFFGEQRESILTTNSIGKNAIGADYLDLRGIVVKDGGGKERVTINGNNGMMTIKNGKIRMENYGQIIEIDPDEGLVFTSDNKERVRMDITNGNVILGENASITAPYVIGGEISGGVFRATGLGYKNEPAYYIQNGDVKCGYISFDDSGMVVVVYHAARQQILKEFIVGWVAFRFYYIKH